MCDWFEKVSDDDVNLGKCHEIGHMVKCGGNIKKCCKPRPKFYPKKKRG